MEQFLAFATTMAKKAGEVMRQHFGADFDVKAGNEAVTIADKAINRMLIEEVEKTYPDHSIFGEEETSLKANAKYVWVCDPIDGTMLYTNSVPLSVFSLALVVDGVSQLGVVYDPFSDKLYTAIKGQGAFVNGQPIHVNQRALQQNTVVNSEWWPAAEIDVDGPLHQLSIDTKTYITKVGSTIHACMMVARGNFTANVFPGTKGKCMDIAAAKVIVEEAGGKVTDIAGNDQRYDQGDINGAIVSNGVVHDQLVLALKAAKR